MRNFVRLTAIAVAVLGATAALAADPALVCESGKLKASSSYAACRLKVDAAVALKGGTADYSKCDAKFNDKFPATEAKAGPMVCPSNGDVVSIKAFLDACELGVAAEIGGGSLPPPAPLLKTGSTACFDTHGSTIPCAGTGQDGELRKGRTRSFTDNGDATITDNDTGLIWEELDYNLVASGVGLAGIHFWEKYYTLDEAYAKISDLNLSNFAGHNDWRLPNRFELESLVNLHDTEPSAYPAFSNCSLGCQIPSCSCTNRGKYWSSSSSQPDREKAWVVEFFQGSASTMLKTDIGYVRAVRGGA